VRVGIVAPAEDTGVRNIFREQVTEPVDTVIRGPCPFSMAVETMNSNDANKLDQPDRAPGTWQGTGSLLLQHGVKAFRNDL
jgi:hypothetical protein